MSDFELQIAELKKKIEDLENKKNTIPSYQYSKIRDVELDKLVEIEENFNTEIFNKWLNHDINLSNEVINFLTVLIKRQAKYIKIYKEEDLKIKFLTPILNKVDFFIEEEKIRDFYEEKLTYSSENFTLNGTIDFLVSKGLKKAEKPMFFIQEFKRAEDYSNPRPQLLAELISAVELNNWKTIKGAYIIGENWNFVILNRLEKHKYEYFVSRTFNSTNFEDLKGIYRNLLFVKQEIIEMVKRGE